MVTSVLCTADAVGSRRTEKERTVRQSVRLFLFIAMKLKVRSVAAGKEG